LSQPCPGFYGNALVLSILGYGGIIYDGLTVSNKIKLQRIQNSGMGRFIYGVQRRESLTPIYAEWRCLQMEDRTRWLLMSFSYRVVVKGAEPDYYILEKFSCVSSIHGYSTRNRQHAYVIPKAKTRIYEASFHVLATNLCNSPPRNKRGMHFGHCVEV